MPHTPVNHHTFVIERDYPVPVARLFSAFADPARKRRWFADGHESHDVVDFELDFRIGGREHTHYRMKEGTPFPGVPLVASGFHLDIVPDSRIVTASTMTVGSRPISASLVTAEFIANAAGSRLVLTHQGAFFEGADGPQMRQGGWGKLLDHLSKEFSVA